MITPDLVSAKPPASFIIRITVYLYIHYILCLSLSEISFYQKANQPSFSKLEFPYSAKKTGAMGRSQSSNTFS